MFLSGLLRPYRSDLVKKSSVVLYLNPPFISHAGAKLSLSITRLLKSTVVSQQRAKLVACGVERGKLRFFLSVRMMLNSIA